MNKVAIIEMIQDKLDPYQRVESKKWFHPEIIAYEADVHYRYLLRQAFMQDPYSIEGCLHTELNSNVYRDEVSGYLYSILPKEVIEFFPLQGGIYSVQKSSDASIGFEPLSTHFEKREWNRLSVNFNNKVRFWYDKSVEDTDVSSSISVPFVGFKQFAWFKSNDITLLKKGDKVNLDLLLTFYAHDDKQNVHVPTSVGGVSRLVELTYVAQARKMGIQIEENNQFGQQNKEE